MGRNSWATQVAFAASLLVLLYETERAGALNWRPPGARGSGGDPDTARPPTRERQLQSLFLGPSKALGDTSARSPRADALPHAVASLARGISASLTQTFGFWIQIWGSGWPGSWGDVASEICRRRTGIPTRENLEEASSPIGGSQTGSLPGGSPRTKVFEAGNFSAGHSLYRNPWAGFCQVLALTLRGLWARLCTWLAWAVPFPSLGGCCNGESALAAPGETEEVRATASKAVQREDPWGHSSMARGTERWELPVQQAVHRGPGGMADSSESTEFALQQAVQRALRKESVALAGMPGNASRMGGARRHGAAPRCYAL